MYLVVCGVKCPREGDERLSDANSNGISPDGDRGKDSALPAKEKARRKSAKSSNDVGRALKTVYDSTLAEDVPTDFLDLLGKLG